MILTMDSTHLNPTVVNPPQIGALSKLMDGSNSFSHRVNTFEFCATSLEGHPGINFAANLLVTES